MKTKSRIWIYQLISIGLVLLLTSNSCKKDDDNINTTGNAAIIFNPNLTYGTMTDIDGNVYKTITIGSKGSKSTQTWMAENLKVTHYQNGDPIPYVIDTTWMNLSAGAYCNYNYASANSTTYGHMYNLFSIIDSRNIAPIGWHVASADEWNTMINFLGGDSIAGGKLKETGTTHWKLPNAGATNSSGFTAIPGGGGNDHGGFFESLGSISIFWSNKVVAGSIEEPEEHGYYFLLSSDKEYVSLGTFGRGMCAAYIRCIKD